MGPLLSALVIIGFLSAIFIVLFLFSITALRLSAVKAIRSAVYFSIGFLIGVSATGVLSAILFGNKTLTSSIQVVLYLIALAGMGITCGTLAMLLGMKKNRNSGKDHQQKRSERSQG